MGTYKYLGLPSMVGRSKEATFGFIKDRIWHKINSWSSKCLSKAGREVMIKSVLQFIPSYIMSIFFLPNKLVDAIEKMINAFWWGQGGNMRRGVHWMSWKRSSVHKIFGGMGFKDLTSLMWLCLGNKDGGSKLILVVLCAVYLRLNISLILILLHPKLDII